MKNCRRKNTPKAPAAPGMIRAQLRFRRLPRRRTGAGVGRFGWWLTQPGWLATSVTTRSGPRDVEFRGRVTFLQRYRSLVDPRQPRRTRRATSLTVARIGQSSTSAGHLVNVVIGGLGLPEVELSAEGIGVSEMSGGAVVVLEAPEQLVDRRPLPLSCRHGHLRIGRPPRSRGRSCRPRTPSGRRRTLAGRPRPCPNPGLPPAASRSAKAGR